MALIHSKQINPKFTGSFTLSGSFLGDLKSTGSFGALLVNNLDFNTAVSSSAASSGFGTGAGGASSGDFDGNRRVLNKKFPELISSSFNAKTTGSVVDFLNAVFFPNTAPTMSNAEFDIHEFVTASHTVGTVTANDAEHFSYELTFSTQSSYTDDFFSIHSGSGVIKTKVKTASTMNTSNRETDGVASHLFPIEVTDGIAVTQANVFIRVTPNLPPKFRTTSVSGNIITANTGNVNENTTNGTTVLTMFVTDTEDDTITVSPLSQSSENRFSASVSDVVGGKQIVLTTATASFDFETITTHSLFISASDEHHLQEDDEPFLTTLPIEIHVTDNLGPTMASQAFSLNESSGSHTNHGLGASTNSVFNVATVTTNDLEGDTVTFTGLTLTSGSGGSNADQQNPANNPIQITSNGGLQLKAGQFLNSDIFNQYKYNATYQDNFNDASSSGTLTVNVLADPPPSLTPNTPATFSLIESADSGSLVRVSGSDGRTGTQARYTSNETVTFQVNPSDKFSINSSGQLSVNFDFSGSEFKFDDFPGKTLSGSVTCSNDFGTTNTDTFIIATKKNFAPTLVFSDNSDNLNSNEARPTEAGGGVLSTITIADAESDTLNHGSFTFTDPSGQLQAVKTSDTTYDVKPLNNLSGSTTYQMTASIKDVHGFRVGSSKNTFTIAAADIGTLGGDTTSFIIESENSGSQVKENSNGRTGAQSQLTVSYTNPEFGSPAVNSFTSSNSAIEVDDSGKVFLNFELSGSTTKSGDDINSEITYQDQYGNLGSGSLQVNVTTNNAPVPAFSNNSTNLNTNLARGSNLLSTITFSDAESDALNHGTFTFTDPSGQLQAVKSGDTYLVQPTSDLSGSTTYQMTASIEDVHGFRVGTTKNTFTISQAPIGNMSTNGVFYIIESAVSGANVVLNSNGRTGTQGDLNVTYSPNFGSAAVQHFTSSNAMLHIEDNGNLSFKQDVSASAFTFNAGNTIDSNITYRDQYDNIGSGSISINVAKNNPPVITLSPSSVTLPTERTISGSFIASASFSDTESDDINFNSFTIGGANGNVFSASRSGNAMIITANTALSASLSNYQYSVTVKDEHGFHTSNATAGTVTVTPMIYFYKNDFGVTTLNNTSAQGISILGDPGADDIDVVSSSLLAHFKSGSVGNNTVPNKTGTTTLISSQSLYHLASSGSNHSTWFDFGSINLSGNSLNGHQWFVAFPSSSAMLQKPRALDVTFGASNNADVGEYIVYNDNAQSDAPESAGLHYFSTYSGVKRFGVDRFGIIFALGANAATAQKYKLLISSGSQPTSEFPTPP